MLATSDVSSQITVTENKHFHQIVTLNLFMELFLLLRLCAKEAKHVLENHKASASPPTQQHQIRRRDVRKIFCNIYINTDTRSFFMWTNMEERVPAGTPGVPSWWTSSLLEAEGGSADGHSAVRRRGNTLRVFTVDQVWLLTRFCVSLLTRRRLQTSKLPELLVQPAACGLWSAHLHLSNVSFITHEMILLLLKLELLSGCSNHFF